LKFLDFSGFLFYQRESEKQAVAQTSFFQARKPLWHKALRAFKMARDGTCIFFA